MGSQIDPTWEPTEDQRKELEKLVELRDDPRALVRRCRELAPQFGRKASELTEFVIFLGKEAQRLK